MSIPPGAGARIGPYQIIEPIGAGGMGVVYRATDSRLGRDVALKFLSSEFAADSDRLARFEREARVLASLNHPNIAVLYGVEESGPDSVLAMELVQGQTLAERIANGPIPIEDTLNFARQLAEALEYAHEHGVIHRDLKPANIKISSDGIVKVLDFGLAKAFSADPSSTILTNSPTMSPDATQAGVLLGTAAYMSPEQAKGKPADRRADIWAFGVILFEMITGTRTFGGETVPETLGQVLFQDTRWDALPQDIPPRLTALLKRCLTRDPRSRLQSMGDARIEIEQIPQDPAVAAIPTPIRGGGWRRREVALAALALVFLATTAVLSFRASGTPDSPAPLVRFNIVSPEDVRIPVGPGEPLSPDGRTLAYIGDAVGSPPVLWVRLLESSSSEPIRGTEGVLRFYWSSDSKYIAFVTATNIQKVEVPGGAPQLLANEPGRDLAWSSQGVILIGGTGPLLRVSETGGQPVAETELDKTLNEVRHDYPRFLPDGRHYLFMARKSDQPEARAVYVGTLGSKERHPLPDLTTDARYSPTGHLVFLRDGNLMAQAFDDKSFKLSGEAFVIASQAAPATAVTSNFSLSSSGDLAYLQTEDTSETRLVWFSRSGKELNQEPVTGSFQAPNLSSDGRQVVYQRGEAGKSDIWALDLARGTDMRLTFNGDSARPVFSADGKQFVFVRSDGKLYRKAASGTGPEEQLLEGEPTDWSPNGQHILFIRSGDLWALSLSDKKETVVATGRGNDRRGRFSRDGKWIAYESDESGRFEVYIQNFPSNGNRWQVSANGGGSAWWSSDGKELFFYATDGKLMTVALKLGTAFEASPPQALFQVPGIIANGRFVASLDAQSFLLPLRKEGKPFLSVVLNWLRLNETK
jgi:serine/threonine protein kinase